MTEHASATSIPRLSRLARVLAPTGAPAALAPVRAMGGFVFVVAGLVKLLFENQGALRFAKIGLSPGVAAFVSIVEVLGGAAWVLGVFTRPAALALAVDMACAISLTKLPFLVGPGVEPLHAPPTTGFFAFAYQARLDLLLFALAITLLFGGAGPASVDARLAARGGGAPARR